MMRALMTTAFATALTLVSGVAMAQSYGPGDPAWADTTDPQSLPTPRTYYGPAEPWGYGESYGYETYSRPYQGDWRWSSGYQPRHGGYDWW
jgi:hypothetical protein